MTDQSSHSDLISLRLSRGELTLLANTINESLEALEDWDYPIRIGADKKTATDLHEKLSGILKAAG